MFLKIDRLDNNISRLISEGIEEVNVRIFIVRKTLFLSFVCLMIAALAQPALAKDEVRYAKVNIHTQSKNGKTFKASYANYTNPGAGHVVIPAGTEILVVDKSRKSFTFKFDGGTKKVVYEFHEPRMGMSLDEYIDKISSLKPVSLDGLSAQDRKGVDDGRAYPGMSREGVMIALGYPAAHRTPSLDATTWIYWTNRFGTVAVDFDADGLVSAVRD